MKWLQEYLLTCGVTLITVSHDSGFLDTICTGIIHYEDKKLVKYKGNLSEFVARKPEAAAYYKLTDEFQQFHFPLPGFLDGVRCSAAVDVVAAVAAADHTCRIMQLLCRMKDIYRPAPARLLCPAASHVRHDALERRQRCT